MLEIAVQVPKVRALSGVTGDDCSLLAFELMVAADPAYTSCVPLSETYDCTLLAIETTEIYVSLMLYLESRQDYVQTGAISAIVLLLEASMKPVEPPWFRTASMEEVRQVQVGVVKLCPNSQTTR